MSALLELAERCEKATGPNFALEQEIGEAVGFGFDREWGGAISKPAPAYTASLDAAMTLVPEGHKWSVAQQDSDKPTWQWWGELRRGHWTSYDKAFPARAATPALALCAAALRARANQGDQA